MEAIRLHPNADRANPYSAENPAPASALILDSDLPIPRPSKPGELLIKVEATTVVRDALTWPETYLEEYAILGNDFAGTVVAVGDGSDYKPGDEVYGMSDASKAGTWAQYALVLEKETSPKPKTLTWAQAAAVPLSGLTAYQALFVKAGLAFPDMANRSGRTKSQDASEPKAQNPLLITGASGGVGLYIVQLAKLAGLHVVAATRSNARNEELLRSLGADEIVEYSELTGPGRFHTIIDTVGGDVLKSCWSLVQDRGTLVTIESLSYNFVEEHQKLGLSDGKDGVQAIWFVVSPSRPDLEQLSAAIDADLLKPFVANVAPLKDASLAYDNRLPVPSARGKTILAPQHV